MATHIIMLVSPVGTDELEDFFSLLSACPDNELLSALMETEGAHENGNDEWVVTHQEFTANMLADALLELEMAREELRLAEIQFQSVASELESIQVLEDMAEHARRTYDDTFTKLKRIEKFIEYANSHKSSKEAEELLSKAVSLKEKLSRRLSQWSDEYATSLEKKLHEAKKQFQARRVSIDAASAAIVEAQEAVKDAEALVDSFQ